MNMCCLSDVVLHLLHGDHRTVCGGALLADTTTVRGRPLPEVSGDDVLWTDSLWHSSRLTLGLPQRWLLHRDSASACLTVNMLYTFSAECDTLM